MIESRRRRILLVTRNLPPLVGGMERLNWHMADELAKVADVRIIGPTGAAALAPSGSTVREVPLAPIQKFLVQALIRARQEALRWRPDIVLAGSGLTAPIALFAARACDAKTAAYVHGLDLAVKHVAYRTVWLPTLRRMNCLIANSNATAELCRSVGIAPERIGIVHPGVDLPKPIPPDGSGNPFQGLKPQADVLKDATFVKSRAAFRERYQLGSRPLLLSVGRLSSRKGLREFVTHALPRIVMAQPDALLTIVGDAPKNALHAEPQTPESIQAAADASGVGTNIRFLGVVTDAELDTAYSAANVHVFPVREIQGDIEGFGMVAVEAAAHGVPTVAFATGGVLDAVAEGKSGYLVVSGDYMAFADAILDILDKGNALRKSCTDFANRFAWPAFGIQMVRQLAIDVPLHSKDV